MSQIVFMEVDRLCIKNFNVMNFMGNIQKIVWKCTQVEKDSLSLCILYDFKEYWYNYIYE